MKLSTALLITACLALPSVGCAGATNAPPDANKDSPESRLAQTADGSTEVHLDAATTARIGLETTPVAAASLAPEVRAFCRVLDPAPLTILVLELASAQTTLALSQREYERLKGMRDRDQSASARAVEAAEAETARNRIAVEALQLKLVGGWGTDLSRRTDLPETAHALTVLDAALVRVDVPLGELGTQTPVGAHLLPLGPDQAPIDATLIGRAPTVEPQSQGIAFLALVQPNPRHLAPGAALPALLSLRGDPTPGVTVPRKAVLRFDGRSWIYVATAEGVFLRREVTLVRPTDAGWFVSHGLAAGDRVVTTGAALLLSEELKGRMSKE